ncbi:MAG TPA: response regulator transcription factor [Jatrophihabitans sp.]
MTESEKPIRIFLLDDHEVVRRGLADLLSNTPGFEIVGEASSVEEARARIFDVAPDVAVLDGRLPDGSGIDVCRDIRSRLPGTYCLILTSYDDQDAVMAAVLAGASGYVLKEVRGSGLIDAIRQVALGRTLIDPGVMEKMINQIRNPAQEDGKLAQLSDREREVLDLIADGLTNRQIAERLFLAETTVKNYVSSLLAKLGMNRRTQAAVYGADLRRN